VLALRVSLAFFLRDLRIETSYKAGFPLQILGGLLTVVMFYFIALVFRGRGATSLEEYGGSYFSFALVGLAFSAYMSQGIGGVASSLRDGRTQGTLELIVLSPVRTAAIFSFSSLPSYVLGSLTVLAALLTGVALGADLGEANVPMAVLSLVPATASFVALGLFAAALVLVTKRGNPVAWAIRAASILLAGVFYPVSVLPGPLEAASQAVPLTHVLELMRGSLLRGEGPAELWPNLLALAALTAVLFPLGLLACRATLRVARTDGSLTG
jgi:ABC-2 type transport system permease protein